MRVVLVTPFTPPLLGGVERFCSNLARGLVEAGHSALIIGQFSRSHRTLRQRFRQVEPARFLTSEAVPIRTIEARWPGGLGGALAYALIWQPLLRRAAIPLMEAAFAEDLGQLLVDADVVHYIGTGADPLGFATAAAVSGRRAVFCIQPMIHPGQWGDRGIDAMLYRRADCVMAYSRSEAALIARLGVAAHRIRRVPGSVDPPAVTDSTVFRRRHDIKGPLVLFVGRKTKEKGLDLLLAAWPSVHATIPAATLAILGPGQACSREASGSGGIVELTDASELEKHEALAACDLFCLPSAGESFGMAIFEACAHGKAVIAGDVPALRETLAAAGAGRLVDLKPAALSLALIEMLSDAPMRTAMAERGRAMTAAMTHERMVSACLASYASAAGRRVTG
jgi:glycosyltransferase involved in cell wall biosynthesis